MTGSSFRGGNFSDVRGVSPAAETYTLRLTPPPGWSGLEFTDPDGNRGTLKLRMSGTPVFFYADLQDGQQAGAGGPLLYKEWRFEGPIAGTGIFRAGATGGARFLLILQGRGNMCRNEEDFKSWILKVKGPRADYTFYGSVSWLSPDAGESANFVPAGFAAPSGPLYFSFPRAAVERITELLRAEDWRTLARYYDLTGTSIKREDLASGRFFLRQERPATTHPGLPWKYRHPFTPGFKLAQAVDRAEVGVVTVVVFIEIDEGGGRVQRGQSEFAMRWSNNSYQILPPDLERLR